VKDYSKNSTGLSVSGDSDFPAYWFYLGAPALQGEAYLPSFGPRLGPRIIWEDVASRCLRAADPRPSVPPWVQYANRSHLNSYWRQNAMDIYYQHFRDFTPQSGRELSVHRPNAIRSFPTRTVTNAGFNWYYVTIRNPSA